jgi:sarcosine oxidase subunit alpha
MPDDADGPVRYRGRPVEVRPGETLAQALGRHGERILRRSVRYHRPRGPFCGVGDCAGCLVRVNGAPNVRACRYEPKAGDTVESENAWPSPDLDLYGLLDLVSGSGFDTHRPFRPNFATPLYYRGVRWLTGVGRLGERAASSGAVPGESVDADTVVVGAGAAGTEVAHRLASAGHPPLVLDRGRPVGDAGTLGRCAAVFLAPAATGAERPFTLLAARDDGRGLRVRARRVVVATGGYDGNLLFAGNDRPGIQSAEGAIATAPPGLDPPFRRAIVLGGGARAAELLDRWGPFVEAVVAPGPVGPDVVRRASELGVDLFPRSLVVRSLGRRAVRGLELAGRGGGPSFQVDGDAVLLAHRRLPNAGLAFQAGARGHWRAETGAYYPVLGSGVATTVPGLFVVGEAGGFVGAAALESARAAADAILGNPADPPAPARVRETGAHELEGYYRELLHRPPPPGKVVACPCEDVLLKDVADASRRGYRGIEVVKRYTSLGAGLCQGRYCLPDALLVLSVWEGRPPAEVGVIRSRPPLVPTAIGTLAGLPDPAGGSP